MRLSMQLLRKLAVFSLAAGISLAAVGDARSQSRRGSEGKSDGLGKDEIETIIRHAVDASNRTASLEGLRTNSDGSRGPVVKRPVKMHIAVVDREGKVLRVHSMTDAWVGSEDIAIAKARTAAFFSSNENALTSRIIGELAQAHGPDGTGGAGPLWGIWASNQAGTTGDKDTRNGLITFPGGLPIYKDGKLVGGIGVSGDGVDQDESVAFGGIAGFEPGPNVVKLGFTAPSVPAME